MKSLFTRSNLPPRLTRPGSIQCARCMLRMHPIDGPPQKGHGFVRRVVKRHIGSRRRPIHWLDDTAPLAALAPPLSLYSLRGEICYGAGSRRSMIRCHKWHIGADEAHFQSFADFHPDRVRRRIGAAVDGEIIPLSAGGSQILPAAGSSRVAVQPWPIRRFQESHGEWVPWAFSAA